MGDKLGTTDLAIIVGIGLPRDGHRRSDLLLGITIFEGIRQLGELTDIRK